MGNLSPCVEVDNMTSIFFSGGLQLSPPSNSGKNKFIFFILKKMSPGGIRTRNPDHNPESTLALDLSAMAPFYCFQSPAKKDLVKPFNTINVTVEAQSEFRNFLKVGLQLLTKDIKNDNVESASSIR